MQADPTAQEEARFHRGRDAIIRLKVILFCYFVWLHAAVSMAARDH